MFQEAVGVDPFPSADLDYQLYVDRDLHGRHSAVVGFVR